MSLPSPVLPPEVVARTRIQALLAEVSQEPDPKLRAPLAYEVGALIELRLFEPSQALEHYRYAVQIDPSFRPPLFALRRLLEDTREHESLVRVLAQLVNASTLPAERAEALVDLGCLLEDHLNDPAGARSAFERALSADPSCLSAILMLERSLLAQKHRAEAQALTARRAGFTGDPRPARRPGLRGRPRASRTFGDRRGGRHAAIGAGPARPASDYAVDPDAADQARRQARDRGTRLRRPRRADRFVRCGKYRAGAAQRSPRAIQMRTALRKRLRFFTATQAACTYSSVTTRAKLSSLTSAPGHACAGMCSWAWSA